MHGSSQARMPSRSSRGRRPSPLRISVENLQQSLGSPLVYKQRLLNLQASFSRPPKTEMHRETKARWKEFVPAGASPAVEKALKVKGRLGLKCGKAQGARCWAVAAAFDLSRLWRPALDPFHLPRPPALAEAQGPAAQPRLRHRPVRGGHHQLRLLHRALEF